MADNAEKYDEKPSLGHRLAEKADKLKFIVLGILVVIVAVVTIFTYQRRQAALAEAKAENALYQSVVELMNNPEMDAIALFDKLAKEYKGMPTGADALIFKFGHSYNSRDYAVAEQAARELLDGYPKISMAERIRLSLGQAQLMQGKTDEALKTFRDLVANASLDILPEAKFALAQALQMDAEKVKDNPEEYHRRLEAAENEYNDIIVRSQISIPEQRGFWPQAVTVPADFSLVVIKDTLAGYSHESPRATGEATITPTDLEGAALVTPPSEAAQGDAAAPAEKTGDEPGDQEKTE